MGVSEAPWGVLVFAHKHDPPCGQKTKNKGEIDVKKIISIALALLMVAVMLPVMAMADETTTLQDQINAANEGDTIKLDKDYTEDIVINKKLTIDLNNHKLTNKADDTITVNANGNLTITGNGTVDNVTHGRAAIFNNGTVTLNGGTYTRSAEVGTGKDPNSDNGNSWYTICNHGVMTVNAGATVKNKGTFSSVFENGYYSYTKNAEREGYVEGTNNAAPKLTINGGTFEGGKITIKNDDGGILEINNGTFTNAWNRVVYNVNVATINGGSFSCPASNEIAVDSDKFNDTVNKGVMTITGGTFDGKVTKSNGTVTVSGGTFKKGVDKSYIVDGKKLDANGNVVPETITIIVPSDGGNTTTTPSTDNTKNPGTGANDFVGVAAAMAVVSLLGAAAVIRKK